jgi:hypothetical protein
MGAADSVRSMRPATVVEALPYNQLLLEIYVVAVANLINDTPYLSVADIPAGFYAGGIPLALEDFEDGNPYIGPVARVSGEAAWRGGMCQRCFCERENS